MSELTRKYITDLQSGVTSLFASEDWTKYLDFVSRFHNYSANNTVAIFTQFPDATRVASYTDFQKMGRRLKKGSKGIKIIAPHTYKDVDADGNEVTLHGFHLAYCYDISQTYGEPIPEHPCHKLTDSVTGYDEIMTALKAVSPCTIEFDNRTGEANGFYIPVAERIVVNSEMSEEQKIKTTVHEMAHAMLHNKTIIDYYDDRLRCEVEAESVAYTVCRYLGIDTSEYSLGYIAEWSGDKEAKELKQSLEAIVRTSDAIIKNLESLWGTE